MKLTLKSPHHSSTKIHQPLQIHWHLPLASLSSTGGCLRQPQTQDDLVTAVRHEICYALRDQRRNSELIRLCKLHRNSGICEQPVHSLHAMERLKSIGDFLCHNHCFFVLVLHVWNKAMLDRPLLIPKVSLVM